MTNNSQELLKKMEERRRIRKEKRKNKKIKNIIGIEEYEQVKDLNKVDLGGFIKYYDKEKYEKGDEVKSKGYGILLKVDGQYILLTNGYGRVWRVSIADNIFYYKAHLSDNKKLRYQLMKLLNK